MRMLFLAAFGALTLAALPAQEPVKPNAAQTAEELFQLLDREFRDADAARMSRYYEVLRSKKFQAARAAKDSAKMRELRGTVPALDKKPFISRFQDGAKKFAGTDGAIPFLQWLIAKTRDDDVRRSAINTLLSQHIESSKIGKFVDLFSWYAPRLGFELQPTLQMIIDKSPHDLVKAHAYRARAEIVLRNRKNSSEAKLAAANKDMEMAEKLAGDSLLGLQLRGEEFVEKNLQVGMTAPDIVGEDLDGVGFKLSDYRGKVVVLDFWGDW